MSKLQKENEIAQKSLLDKETLIEVLHKKSRSKKQKISQKCADLHEKTVTLRNELNGLRELFLKTEEDMKNELNQMEKQLHKGTFQYNGLLLNTFTAQLFRGYFYRNYRENRLIKP